MITRLADSLVLQPSDIEPSAIGWEVIGVFNPAVAILGDQMVMLARVAEQPSEKRIGWTALPRWTNYGKPEADWVRDEELRRNDARVVTLNQGDGLRLTSVSHLQLFTKSTNGSDAWEFKERLLPVGVYEQFGIEDPRISKIDETYWITYVAIAQAGISTALMSTTDFVNFKRHGIIFACENKDVVLFPQRISGDHVALHRPNPSSKFSPPQIWIARSPDLVHWGRHKPLLNGVQPWESGRVGSGTPPVLIDEGWLTLYHGSELSQMAGTVGRYTAGALLLDRHDPSQVIARSRRPILVPITDYETKGFVPNVVFPTALLDVGGEWHVFYGAADTSVAMTRFSKRSVFDSLFQQSDAQ